MFRKKLFADLHLLSVCVGLFVARRTQQVGVVRQSVFQISFQQFLKLDEFVVNVRFQIVFMGRHKPLSSRTNIISVSTPEKQKIASQHLNRPTCVG